MADLRADGGENNNCRCSDRADSVEAPSTDKPDMRVTNVACESDITSGTS